MILKPFWRHWWFTYKSNLSEISSRSEFLTVRNDFCEKNEHSDCHARNTTQEVIVRWIWGRLALAIRIFPPDCVASKKLILTIQGKNVRRLFGHLKGFRGNFEVLSTHNFQFVEKKKNCLSRYSAHESFCNDALRERQLFFKKKKSFRTKWGNVLFLTNSSTIDMGHGERTYIQ